MKVKIKKLNESAVIPKYSKAGDDGMDLVATSKETDKYGNIVYGTGLAFEIPKGYVGLLFPRSSISKYDMNLTNSTGVLDSGYRGEVFLKFKRPSRFTNFADTCSTYNTADRIGQIIILSYPQIAFEEVEELSETDRGTGGLGSTGK